MHNLNIRKYQFGDEAGILKLFLKVFNIKTSIKKWNWQYIENKQGKSWIMLSLDGSEVVGHIAIRRNDINYKGQRIIAGQSCDGMVSPEHRGKNLFTRLTQENYRVAVKDGLKLAFGFPNRSSYPAHMRNLGWSRICNLKCHYYRIGLRKLLGGKIDFLIRYLFCIPNIIQYHKEKWLLSEDADLYVSKKLNNSIQDLLKEALNYEVFSVWKDMEYFKWRYENHPSNSYTFHILNIKNIPQAIAVCQNDGERIAICDLISRTKDLRLSVLLIRHIVHYYFFSSAQKIEFSGYDNGHFDAVFFLSGFKSFPSRFVLIAKAFDGIIGKCFMIPDNWTVTQGDTDVI